MLLGEAAVHVGVLMDRAPLHRVFQEVIESRWDAGWADLLRDRDVPLRARLLDFYQRYLDAIDDGIWIRIVMYASLDGLDMTRGYITANVEDLMQIIAAETREDRALDGDVDHEHLWQLQSTLIYYLVRKHIHLTPVSPERPTIVAMAVDTFLDGLPQPAGR